MFEITDFKSLCEALDKRNRVLVLQVSLDEHGRENPDLWISPVRHTERRLITVDSELVGKAILSDDIVRGPDPHTWSHRKRLEANKRMIASAEVRAANFIRRNLFVNKVIGIAVIIAVVAMTAFYMPKLISMIGWQSGDESDEHRLNHADGEQIPELCYPPNSPACQKAADQ